MALETFPALATNLIYSVLCLVPGFLTLETALYLSDTEVALKQFDKTIWSLIGSGISLSELYFGYVAWVALTTSGVALVVPIDLQWTELVAAYPALVVVAVLNGYVVAHLLTRVRPTADARLFRSGQEQSAE